MVAARRRGSEGGFLTPEAITFAAVGTLIVFLAIAMAFRYLWSGVGDLVRGNDPASEALAAHIEAARRHDCAGVWNGFSSNTRALITSGALDRSLRRPISEADAVRRYCDFSSAQADLSDFLPQSVRLENGGSARAIVSAVFAYDRFFGFFGTGHARAPFKMVFEDGVWRDDLTEAIDPASRTNQDKHAMFLLQQTWTAERDALREFGFFTTDNAVLRRQLPGFEFPVMFEGVASAVSDADTIYLATAGEKVVCMSIRSGSGTLVMVKDDERTGRTTTYQWGSIPSICDDRPLKRPYYGASSDIH